MGASRQRVQHVDRVVDVQALSQPARHGRPRVQLEPFCFVPRSEDLHEITADFRVSRHLRQELSIRSTELQLAV